MWHLAWSGFQLVAKKVYNVVGIEVNLDLGFACWQYYMQYMS